MYRPVLSVLSLFILAALLLACDASNKSPKNILSEVEAVELLELPSAMPFLTATIEFDKSELIEKVDLSAKAKILVRRGYLRTETIAYKESRPVFAEQIILEQIKLEPPIMNTLLRYTEKENRDFESLAEFNSVVSARLHIGRIKEVSVSDINAAGSRQYTVNYDLIIQLNDLGSILYPAGLRIPWRAEFVYGADGWTRQLGNAGEKDALLKDEFSGFVSKSRLLVSGLGAMYETGVYPTDWRDFVAGVEDSEEFTVLEDVAWAYHNNGESARAIALYENKILPLVAHSQPVEVIVRLEEQLAQIRSEAVESKEPATE